MAGAAVEGAAMAAGLMEVVVRWEAREARVGC